MADKWTDRTLRAITKPGMHRDPESRNKLEKGALYLGVKEGGAKSWYFRFQLNGRRRKMGLGRSLPLGFPLPGTGPRLRRQGSMRGSIP